MRIKSVVVLSIVLFLSAVVSVAGQPPSQPSSTQAWSLPHGVPVKDSGPRTYRVTMDYKTSSAQGEVIYRQHVTGEYARGLAGGEVAWKILLAGNQISSGHKLLHILVYSLVYPCPKTGWPTLIPRFRTRIKPWN
ncbi:MAG: hypothetical protein ACRD4O_01380 [Bryobacteraceae bacterium]